MKKIVTHAGQFHADEILSVEMIKLIYGNIPVERTFTPSELDLNDSKVAVLDIGGNFTPWLNNFDHHHDPSLPATNLLVFNKFAGQICDVFEVEPQDRVEFCDTVRKNLLNYISDVDCSIVLEQYTPHIPTLYSIIRNLNSLNPCCNGITSVSGFEIASEIAKQAFIGACETAKLTVKGRKLWNSFPKLSAKVKLQETTEIIPNWRDLAVEDGIMMLVQKNLRGGWQVVSRNSDELVLPVHPKQTFRHNSGFMCVFAEKQEAIYFALGL